MRILFLLLASTLVSIVHAADTKKDSLYIKGIHEEAYLLISTGNVIESLEKIQFAIAESKLNQISDRFVNGGIMIFLANRYSNIGDFDRAIELTKNLESFFKQTGDLEGELEVKNNLGVYHLNIGRYAIAYQYYSDCWEMQSSDVETYKKLDWLDGLAASCIELGRLDETELYLLEAERLLNNYSSEWKEELLLYYYVTKSNYAFAIADEVQAEKHLLKCVGINEELNSRKGADAYQLLANLYLKQGKYQQALHYTDKVVSLLDVNDPYLLQSYSDRAKAFLALNNYEEALLNCEKAEDQAMFFQRKYMFNESKLFIGELRRENLETGITALYYKYQQSGKVEYLEQALIYVYRAKSNVLNERWENSKILAVDNRKEEITLRLKLIFQLNELEGKESSDEVIVLRNRLDSLNEVLGVKKEAPFLVDDLRAFQSNLKKGSICLEYMVIDTLLFRFDIQKNKIEWSAEILKSPEVIFNFYDIIKNPASTSQEFILAASKLPVLLPKQLLKDSSIKEISIIPDGVLNYIIFDAIPSDPGNGEWGGIRYLAEDYSFSYQFSIQSSENQAKPKDTINYIGFAPDYSDSKTLSSLKKSKSALDQAQDYFGGVSHFGAQATKKRVQEFGPTADVLHFYAHGVSNDSSYDASYLILQDGEMYVDEVLALPLTARLCFLTACEVGLGKEYKGEGITGIAWAFKAAGAENVIQSMWKLNEQSSSQVMSYFFEDLEESLNSSQVLTHAKRQYLESSEISNRLKHPYYWAGIGHYGNGAIFAKKANYWMEIALGFVLLLGVWGGGRKHTMTKRGH